MSKNTCVIDKHGDEHCGEPLGDLGAKSDPGTALYEVHMLDVWGNEEDGYDVNDIYGSVGRVRLSEGMSDKDIFKALMDEGIINRGDPEKFSVDGEFGYILFVEYDGKPEFQLHPSGSLMRAGHRPDEGGDFEGLGARKRDPYKNMKVPPEVQSDRAALFFWEHGAMSYTPGKETRAQGRARGALALAEAEREARERGWYYNWEHDPEPEACEYDDGTGKMVQADECLWCALYDEGGEQLASLGGIGFNRDHTPGRDPYKRVVEAELADEALHEIARTTGAGPTTPRYEGRSAGAHVRRRGEISDLDQLFNNLRTGAQRLHTNLPTFGGAEPRSTSQVWSWDETRLLVGTCQSDLELVERDSDDFRAVAVRG